LIGRHWHEQLPEPDKSCTSQATTFGGPLSAPGILRCSGHDDSQSKSRGNHDRLVFSFGGVPVNRRTRHCPASN